MNSMNLVSLIALIGWLVLALSAYKSHRVGKRKTLVIILTWGAIFAFLTMIFTAFGW